MKFLISGMFSLGGIERSFSKEVSAPSQNAAVEKIYAEFGSKNGVTRNLIKIKEVKKSE